MKLSIKNILVGTAMTATILVAGATDALAATIKGSVTADNFYGLFYGSGDGSDLNFVGRNELGGSGDPGQYNWSIGEEWEFEADAADYIYVVTWDDSNVAEAWLGEFSIDGNPLLTGDDEWEYITGGDNPYLNNNNAMPSDAELSNYISTGNWGDTVSIFENSDAKGTINEYGDSKAWGTIAGISGDADWLKTASHTEGKYTIFRTKVPVGQGVPEPASLLGLLAIGALGGSSALKRNKDANN